MSTEAQSGAAAPPLIVSSRDFDRLEQLLDSPALRQLPASRALMQELVRAEVRPAEQVPPDVVAMGSISNATMPAAASITG